MTPEDSIPHRSLAEIDRGALLHNLGVLQGRAGAGVKIMAVVKADAYGHGAEAVAGALEGRVAMFGVANVREGLELRAAGLKTPIVLLGPALAGERPAVAAAGFVPTVSSLEEAAAYSALDGSTPLEIHVKIDTGMGRIGIWQEEARPVVRAICALPGVRVGAVATHLPVADEDDAFTAAQLERFQNLVEELRADGLGAAFVHAENSAGVIGFSSMAGDMVRLGLSLYGSAPRPGLPEPLQPVMTWKTRVVLVRKMGAGRSLSYGRSFVTERPMLVATLAVGYADGYRRTLSNRGAAVLIGGRRCAVLGRVTMDQILVDVSELPGVEAGEEVVLMGRQGAEEITAAELAQWAGTIAWEIFTGVGPRVARVVCR